jgi:hypothetical protein
MRHLSCHRCATLVGIMAEAYGITDENQKSRLAARPVK